MANHGRSPDGQYPQPSIWSGQPEEEPWPQAGPRTGPRTGRASPPTDHLAPSAMSTAQRQSPELPPPEWADPAIGRRWTQSWRVAATGAQPRLPQERPPARRPTGAMPRRDTGSWPTQAPRDAATRAIGTVGSTGGFRATSGPTAMRSTGALHAASAARTTGAMRTAKPIAPGTGRARIVLPVVVIALIALGLAGVIILWWKSTLFLHTTGAVATDIGEVLGLLAGYGVVILVALMARLPPLEKGIGTDRLARWHAWGGRIVISVVSGHVVFIIWGFAVTARENVVSETLTLEKTFPDVLMATVAWGLLLMVAVISLRAARRRVAYETWYYAHLYTYLAIALAFSHQFANGGAFAENFQARVAWSALYAVVGGLLLWYRVITPIRRSVRHQFTVQSVRPEAEGIVSVLITGREFDHLRAEPGQFFRWRFFTRELWWQSHPYSLSAMPQPDLMRITVKARGDHSGSLANLKPGTRIIAEGPYGAFTPSLTGRRVLFIAGGVGITPVRAMFAALPKRMSGGITLLYRASHPRDVVFSRELNAIANDRDAALHYLIGSRKELGYDPLDARHLQQIVPGLHRYEAYVCGPTGMTQAAVEALAAVGIPRRRIHHESFDL
ncbi:MAG: ferric reductase-like transmembrane domain-containing protein [Trebonia sp.]